MAPASGRVAHGHWDVEEDLSRIIGDIPAHAIADAGQRIFAGIKQFIAKRPDGTQSPVASDVQGAKTPTYAADAARAST